MKTSDFDYFLPDELIAKYPANPKSSAKLLVYLRSSNEIVHSTIADIEKFLPKDSVLIFNNTKVMKARLFAKRASGAQSEVLYLAPLANNLHSVMIRGKVKEDSVLTLSNSINIVVKKLHSDGSREVLFITNEQSLGFESVVNILDEFGEIPLPPYMNRNASEEDAKNYQTCFAQNIGSVAAPTASLHFDENAFDSLKKWQHAYVTLHVGAGTFKPVDAESLSEHKMHSEQFFISDEARKIIESDLKITAFGTTACRAIESFVRGKNEQTDIFLHPENPPLRVSHLLTNFHLPKSTLLMLVSAFIGRQKALELYEIAIKNSYRFYSYGDAMLII